MGASCKRGFITHFFICSTCMARIITFVFPPLMTLWNFYKARGILPTFTGVGEAHTHFRQSLCMKHFFPHALSHSPIEYATATQNVVLKMYHLTILFVYLYVFILPQILWHFWRRKKHSHFSNCWWNNRKKVGFLSEGGFTCHLLHRQLM